MLCNAAIDPEGERRWGGGALPLEHVEPRVSVRILDHFAISGPAGEVPLASRKAIALLVYLALQRDRTARRDVLANLLWENVDTAQGRVNLRQVISTLRGIEVLAAPILEAGPETIRLTQAVVFDTDTFDMLVGTEPRAAAELYHSDLLTGFVLRDAPAFNEWLSVMQAHWRQRAVTLLIDLLEAALSRDEDANAAVAIGLRLLQIDPYNEVAHRGLMRVYARQGRAALALAQYRSLSDLLRREMGITPEAETQAVHAALQAARRTGSERLSPSPLTPPADHPPSPEGEIDRAGRFIRIAVVDDEAGVRDAVASYLRLQGFETVECEDGGGLDRALAAGPVDLMILDVTMPGESGFDIARRTNATSRIPTIMLTARTDLIDRVVGLELGADDYVGKPFELRELLARVRAVLRRAEDRTLRNRVAS